MKNYFSAFLKKFLKSEFSAGVFFLVLSAFCFGIMSIFVRLAGDLPSPQKALFRNLVAFSFAAVAILRKKKSEGLQVLPIFQKNWRDLLVRGLAGTLGFVCNFYAIDHMHLGDANALAKLAPFFVILVSAAVLRENIRLFQLAAVLIAFMGTLLIAKPQSFRAFFSGPGAIAVLGAFGAGVAYTFVRRLGHAKVPGAIIVFSFGLVSICILLPVYAFTGERMQPIQLVYMLSAGLAATGGQFAVTAAYKHAPAKEISVFDYSQLLVATMAAWLFFDEVPDLLSFVGYAFIIAAGVFVWKANLKV